MVTPGLQLADRQEDPDLSAAADRRGGGCSRHARLGVGIDAVACQTARLRPGNCGRKSGASTAPIVICRPSSVTGAADDLRVAGNARRKTGATATSTCRSLDDGSAPSSGCARRHFPESLGRRHDRAARRLAADGQRRSRNSRRRPCARTTSPPPATRRNQSRSSSRGRRGFAPASASLSSASSATRADPDAGYGAAAGAPR